MIIHADDYGITAKQAQSLLDLSDACGGTGGLESVSIFANSPVFDEAAQLAMPYVCNGNLKMALHVNLVEGRPCANACDIPLLVNDRGTFANDFIGLLKGSLSPRRKEWHRQIKLECAAQIDRFLSAFPQMRDAMRLDSHQHTHAVPVVFDALMEASSEAGCTLQHVRIPIESITPYRKSDHLRDISIANRIKNVLLTMLCRRMVERIPSSCTAQAFCGVLLSGNMERVDNALIAALKEEESGQGREIEVLFHPVSVPVNECLDPQNAPFANACASPGRDGEAHAVRALA